LYNIKIFLRRYINEIVIFAFSFLSLSVLLNYITGNYFPTGDDISLLVNSTGFFKALNPGSWFTEGYADYFRVYPEWSLHSKEIIRPVANIIIYINSLIFGKSFNLYLYFNIFVHSTGTVIVYYLCNKYFKINKIFSFLAAFTFFFTSAVMNRDYFFYSSFVLDAFVSVIIFFSFISAMKNKSYFAFLLTFVALLTKETSLLIPLAVAVTLYFINKEKFIKYLFIASSVILIWFIYKKLVDVDISAGVNTGSISILKIYAVSIFRGIILWPTGIPEGDLINGSSVLYIIIAVVFNLAFTLFFIIDSFKEYKNKNEEYKIYLSWILASVILLIFFGLSGRFGYTFHLFLIPVVFYLILNSKSIIRRVIYSIFVICIFISGILFFSRLLNSDEIEVYKNKMKCAEQLTELIKSKSDSPEILLINDISAMFGTPFLSDFAGSKSRIIKINSLANYSFIEKEKNKKSGIVCKNYEDSAVVLVDIPDYTEFWFEGVKPELFNHEAGTYFRRNDFIDICFQEENYAGISGLTGLKKYNFGKFLRILIKRKNIPIIYFDIKSGKYQIIEY